MFRPKLLILLWNIVGMQDTVTHLHLLTLTHSRCKHFLSQSPKVFALHLHSSVLSKCTRDQHFQGRVFTDHACFFLGLPTITTHTSVHYLQHSFTRLQLETSPLILKVDLQFTHIHLMQLCPKICAKVFHDTKHCASALNDI